MTGTQAILEALHSRAERRGDDWELGPDSVQVRCFNPAAHKNGDAHPSAIYTFGKYVVCRVCGFKEGERKLAERLGVDLDILPGGLTLEGLAEAKGLPVDFLAEWGWRRQKNKATKRNAVLVPWYSMSGPAKIAPAYHIRHRIPKDGDGPRWTWDKPKSVQLVAYGAWRIREWLAEAEAGGAIPYVFICESEIDVLTLWHSDIPAIATGGADGWRSEWAADLEGFKWVIIWQERDPAGDTMVQRLSGNLPDALVLEAPLDAKDANALWLQCNRDKEAFQRRIGELARDARPLSEIRTAERRAEASYALDEALAGLLLDEPGFRVLDAVEEAIKAGGWAGDPTPPLLSYVAITSRLLERPMNLAFIAPSGAGKNRGAEAPLLLFPASAYFIERAGSARALVYSREDFQHRTVIVAEADSLPEVGPAASAIRSLAADNVMEYDVPEQDPITGKFETRRISKPGPTGLITTSVRSLGEQLSTRMLTVTVPDTPGQTRAVLHAHADAVNGALATPPPGAFVAFQRWLELEGRKEVSVPFAHALADLVSVDLVRMRRDFRQLLTTIQAVAFLNQRQRDVDEHGRVIATAEDYAAARNLLLEPFGDVATGGVTQAVRETVKAAMKLYVSPEPVSLEALAGELKLSRDTTKKRVRRAVNLGYLVNTETRERQPMKLTPGAPLPEERPALPTVEKVFTNGGPLTDSGFPCSPVNTGHARGTGENAGEKTVSPAFPREGTKDTGEDLDSPGLSPVAPIGRKATRELGNTKSATPPSQSNNVEWLEV